MLKEQPSYNVPIEKPKIKHLNNKDILNQLPFYDPLNIVKTEKAFKTYAKSYSIDLIKHKYRNMNDGLVELEDSKPVIKGDMRTFTKTI